MLAENGIQPEVMEHVYLGPSYSDDEIRAALDSYQLVYRKEADVCHFAAQRLAEGKILGWFQGAMEFGPRALGNRSILGDARDPSMKDRINATIKFREDFRPFAPAVLEEKAESFFVNGSTAPFMTITFDCTDWMAENCPGVVHIDNTARPQLVDADDNPSMHRVLKEYQELTGLPCLINTSFNMHEEPIVCSPYDAIRAFKMGHLDYLAIGNWVARNPVPVERKADKARIDSYVNKLGPVRA